jgi:HEAT repeat protein
VGRSIARTLLGGASAVALGLAGCASSYDLLTSQRFKERPFHTLFTSEDPIEVLEKVQEGDDRVRAMRNLKEPRENGGTAAQQDRVIALLQTSATTEKRPLCRLAAVETLGRFKDPRAGQILIAAYHNAPHDGGPAASVGSPELVTPAAVSGLAIKGALSTFTPETVTTLQCRSLEAIGKTRTPDGLQLLLQVATAPTERPKSRGVEPAGALLSLEATNLPSEGDRVDVRLAAIRALGNYEKDPAAIRGLVGVLRVEKDVAVRGRAHESLVKITGQDLPADGQAWANWIDKGAKR